MQEYLNSRQDDNAALFVSLRAPHTRLTINGIEFLVRRLGRSVGIKKCHPHKFRRSCATAMAKRGIGVQDISVILGHEKISTTQEYLVSDSNEVKRNYERMFA